MVCEVPRHNRRNSTGVTEDGPATKVILEVDLEDVHDSDSWLMSKW